MFVFDEARVRRYTVLLLVAIALLAAANAGILALREALDEPDVLDRFGAFDLNREQSIGTWVAAALHALCALLALGAGVTDDRRDGAWRRNE